MHLRPSNRARNPQARSASLESARGESQPSTAWLAAQQAFSGPRPAPESLAVVVVRKGRSAVVDSVLGSQPADVAAEPVDCERPARVFRVDAETAPSGAATLSQPPDGAASMPGTSGRPPRHRRVHTARRPGPVHTLPVAAREIATQRSDAGLTMSEIDSLKQMLALVDVALNDVRSAQAFRIVDPGFAKKWQGLSSAVSKLRDQMR